MSQGRGSESTDWRTRQASNNNRPLQQRGASAGFGSRRGSYRGGGSAGRGGINSTGVAGGGLRGIGARRTGPEQGEGASGTSQTPALGSSSSGNTNPLGDPTTVEYYTLGPGSGRHQTTSAVPPAQSWNFQIPPTQRARGQTHRQAEPVDNDGSARKKRKPLPPAVMLRDIYWDPEAVTPASDRRRFMVLTSQDFSRDMYCQTRGPFMDHVESLLGEARDERAVIDLPKVDVYSESGEGAQDRFFGNQFAGEALKRVSDDFELMEMQVKDLKEQYMKGKDTIRELRLQEGSAIISDLPHLNIPAPHRMILMAKNLHLRYRTMWQMATNAGLIPAALEDSKHRQDSYEINLNDFGGFRPHKERYELCTALAHSGSLRDDLVVGKSQYLSVWHNDPHIFQRQQLYEKMFKELYCMDYETAAWIIEAADMEDVKPAQEWIRLCDRFRYVMDCNYKHSRHGQRDPATGKINQTMSSSTLNNYKTAEKLYKDWTNELKQLVADQQKKHSNDLYRLSAAEKHKIGQTTEQFYKKVKTLLSANWGRLENIKAWKPTEALQRDYNSFTEKHNPFAA